MSDINRKPTKKEIKDCLTKQLKNKGVNLAIFEDQIHDYLSFYDTKAALQRDIKKRGVSYETFSASGVKIVKQNQSVKDLVAVNRQMLSILKELGLTTDEIGKAAMDDEEL